MTETAPQTLPLDVALQQAIAHHEAGRLEEAEQLYRAILQAQPNQPDANHNLGVLAGQVGRHVDGLPHLKAALENIPTEGQYWLSYAEALLAAGHAEEALNIIQTAIQRGLDAPEAQALRQKIKAVTALNVPVESNVPTPEELKYLIELFNAGNYAKLEEQACSLTERFPNSGVSWKILGACLHKQGKKSLPALQKAAELLPDDAEAQNNLGAALRSNGQLDKAAACSRRALEINPDFAEAHNNLGIALQALGQINSAVESYYRALEIKSDYVEAQNNLGIALEDLAKRKRAEAEAAVTQLVNGYVEKDTSLSVSEPIFYNRLWLIVACLVVYVRFLNNPAVFDDLGLIGNKAMLSAYGNSLFFDFTLRWFSYVTFGWVDRFLGANIVWHRAVNLTLHISVVLALYAFFKQLFQSVLLPVEEDAQHQTARFAFWGALIFAVHPVAVYGAGYLVERSIVMATIFAILALHAFAKGLSGYGRKWYFISVAWYFIAVFSKEHAVLLPLAMVAMIPLARRDYRALMRELVLPCLLLFGIALLMAMKTRGLLGTVYEPHAMAMLASAAKNEVQVITAANTHYLSILLQGYLFFKYVFMWLMPNVGWMSVDLQQKFPDALLQWPETVGFLFFAIYPCLAGLLLWRGGKRGLLGYALLFPWLMFLTEFYSVRIVEAFTLYRSYLWMMCLPLALPGILGKLDRKRENVVLAMVAVGLVLLSWNRLNTFTSDFKLWDDAVIKLSEEKTLGMYRAYMNRGLARRDQNMEKALEDMNKAIEINPKNPAPYNNRGALKGSMKRYLDAFEDCNHAVELDPSLAEAYVNRGMAQIGLGNKEKGLSDIAYAVNLQPNNERYRNFLIQHGQ